MKALRTSKLGSDGPEITRVGFGAWAIGGGGWSFGWGPQDDDAALAAMRHAVVDRGINWIDTAAVYGLGHSEVLVGRLLRDVSKGDRPLVFTKCGLSWDESDRMKPPRRDLRPETIRRECEASLRRLGVERIDLYQFHWPDESGTPVEDSWGEMAKLVDEGKVRWAGVSNFSIELLERCEVVTIGIDGGGLDDLLGFTATGRDTDTKEWLSWSHAWAHPSVLQRRKEIAPRLLDFERDGHLTLVKRVGDDEKDVADLVMRIEDAGLLDQVGVDTVGIGAIYTELVARKFAAERIVGISQGWKLVGAIKDTERKLAGGELWHGAAPLMAWCVGNAKVVPTGNAVLITKQASGTAKIDPLMSLFNSVFLMSMDPKTRKRKYQLYFA